MPDIRPTPRAEVTQLPPTTGIQDPAVRSFLDALVAAWNTRSGFNRDDSPDAFLTRGEAPNLASQAVIDAFSTGVLGGAQAGANNFERSAHAALLNNAIDNLSDSIRKSLLNQLLEEDILNISGVRDVATLSGADITAETVIRANADNALARAINNIWANIGGASAVIEDSGLAASGSSSAVATKWNEVVSAVTDTDTGLITFPFVTSQIQSNAVTLPIGGTSTSTVTLTGSNQVLHTLPAMSVDPGVPVFIAVSAAVKTTYTGGSPGPLAGVFEIKRGATVVHSWPVDFPGTSATGVNYINIATNIIDTPGGSATYTLEARTTSGSGSADVAARSISAIALKR